MIINGVNSLKPANLYSTDLRGGAAMVLAALNAEGISKVSNLNHILRGYEDFDKKLRLLGADITKEKEE